MAENPPRGTQRIIPYLITKHPAGVMRFAEQALGFSEASRVHGPEGDLMHGALRYKDNVVMVGPAREGHEGFRSVVYIYVDDVDTHYEKARAAGAKVVVELQDMPYGDRAYGVEDPDGNQWHVATHVRDVSDREVEAAMSGGQE
jgi:uncharacterized glyoxalase superfamily protein PhnB